MDNNHEKLVTISDKSWHYRLIKYVFNIEGKEFKNLCPYFWLIIASIFSCPVVFIISLISKFFSKIFELVEICSDEFFMSEYNRYISNLSEEEVYFLYTYSRRYYNNSVKVDKILPKYILKQKSSYAIFKDWADKHGRNIDKMERKAYKFQETKLEKYANDNDLLVKPKVDFIDELKNSSSKERSQKIIKFTKKIVGLIITLLLVAITFFASQLLIVIITSIIKYIILNTDKFIISLYSVGLTLVYFAILTVISFLLAPLFRITFDKLKNKEWKSLTLKEYILTVPSLSIGFLVYWIFYTVLWKGVIISTYKGILTTIVTCGGIFGEYFGASYSDYCPGIEWEDEEKES